MANKAWAIQIQEGLLKCYLRSEHVSGVGIYSNFTNRPEAATLFDKKAEADAYFERLVAAVPALTPTDPLTIDILLRKAMELYGEKYDGTINAKLIEIDIPDLESLETKVIREAIISVTNDRNPHKPFTFNVEEIRHG